MSDIIEVQSVEDFNESTEEHDEVLLDFYADWCGPCQMMDPIIEDIGEDTSATVVKVNIDEHPNIASEMGVRSVPTYAYVVNGDIETAFQGVQTKEYIEDIISD